MKSNKRIHVQAPAKLNLFLHIISKRKDGYHSLESVFVPISWCDGIDIENTNDDLVTRQGEFVCEIKNDLLYKAANLFKKYAHSHLSNSNKKINNLGCRISLKKNIPSGAGLGGGSSNAAKTLIILNNMWNVNLPLKELTQIGKELGADVPFFLQNASCFVSGIGEKIVYLTGKEFLPNYFVILVPEIKVSTQEIFKLFTTNHYSPSINFSSLGSSQIKLLFKNLISGTWTFGKNDIELVTIKKYPIVKYALELLKKAAHAYNLPESSCRMSGTGGSVFCSTPTLDIARKIANQIRRENTEKITIKVCKRLNHDTY